MKKRELLTFFTAAFLLAVLPIHLYAQDDGANTLRVIPYTVITTTEKPVSLLTFTPDGASLLGTEEDAVIIWDAGTLDESLRITEEAAPRALKISADSGSFLTILQDNTLIVRNIGNGDELLHFKSNSENPVMDAAFINDTHSLALPLDGTSLQKCFILRMTGNFIPKTVAEYESLVYSLDADADGTRLLVSVSDGTVHLLNLADETEAVFAGSAATLLPAAFFPDGGKFVHATDGNALVVRSLNGEELFSVTVPETPSCRIAFSPDGKSFAVPTEAETIRIFDSETGRLVLLLKAPESSEGSHRILATAFSPDGDYLFTSFENGQLIRWTLNSLFISEMTDDGTSYQNREAGDWVYQLPYVPATVSQVDIPDASLFLGAGYTVLLESWYPGSFDLDFCFKKRIGETSMVWGAELTGGGAMPSYRFPYAYHLDESYGGGELPAPWLYSFATLGVFGYELYNERDNRLFFDVFAGPVFRFLWDNSFSKSLSTRLYPSVEAGIDAGLDFKGFMVKVSFIYNTQVGLNASCMLGYSFRFRHKGEKIYEKEEAYEENIPETAGTADADQE